METLIIYHRVDWDGYTSAAVALKRFPNAKLFGWNYKDSLPDVSEYDRVILVDLTIAEVLPDNSKDYSWMHAHADKLIWIDHHMAAVNAVNRPDINGLRRGDVGACILAWEFFFPSEMVAEHVALVGSCDVFRKDGKYVHWDHVWDYCLWLDQFGSGWTLEEGDRSYKLIAKAIELIKETDGQIAQHIVDAAPLEAIRAAQEDELFVAKAEEFTFRGYKAYKLYAQGRPAAMMRTHMDKMACIVFQFPYQMEDGTWKVSIRVSESCPLDANRIANEFGGGGHVKAAGCSMTNDQINNLK